MKLLMILCFILFQGAALAIEQPLLNPAQEQQVMEIARTLRCVMCQGQSVADSNAPVAEDMRQFVRDSLMAGQTKEMIQATLIQRYGEDVLLTAPVSAENSLLWGLPMVVTVIILIVFIRGYRLPNANQKPLLIPYSKDPEKKQIVSVPLVLAIILTLTLIFWGIDSYVSQQEHPRMIRQIDQKLSDYLREYQQTPNDPEPLLKIMTIYQALGMHEPLHDLLQTAVLKFPKNVEIQLLYAHVILLPKDTPPDQWPETYVQQMRYLETLQPDLPEVLWVLAQKDLEDQSYRAAWDKLQRLKQQQTPASPLSPQIEKKLKDLQKYVQ